MTAALACAACGSTSSPGPSYAAGGEGGAALGSAGPAGAVYCRVGQCCDDQTCVDAPFCLIDAGCIGTERYCDLLFSGECRRLCESTKDCQQMSEYSYAQAFKQTYKSCSPGPVPAAGARHDSETSTSRRRQHR